MSTLSPIFFFDSILSLLECPYELEPLTTAVSLAPCMHKINEAAALILYGIMKEGACSEVGKECLLCKQIVKAYHIDHKIREVVKGILKAKEDVLAKSAAVAKEEALKETEG